MILPTLKPLLSKMRRCFAREPHRHAKSIKLQKFEWTFGLCWIFIVLPLVFLLPRVHDQARYRTFRENYARAEAVAFSFTASLPQATKGADQPTAIDKTESYLHSALEKSVLAGLVYMELERNGVKAGTVTPKPLSWITRIFSYSSAPGAALEERGIILFDQPLQTRDSALHLRIVSPVVPFGRQAFAALADSATLLIAVLWGGWALFRLGKGYVELIDQKDLFVASVSHELRTPLANIKLYSELIEQAIKSNKPVPERYLRTISTESDRLSRLIDNLLELARVEGGKGGSYQKGDKVEFLSINQIINQFFGSLAVIVEPKGFQPVLRDTSNACKETNFVKVSPDSLKQIAINLGENIVKFAREPQRREVEVVVDSCKNSLSLAVRDFGNGMSNNKMRAADFDALFRPFTKGENQPGTTAPHGLGIGLSLVQQLMKEMGGTVRAEQASPGFRVILSFSVM